MDVERFIEEICASQSYEGQIVFRQDYPARAAAFSAQWEPVPVEIRTALNSLGIKRLYKHQCEALRVIGTGEDVVLASGSFSGKSLCFQIPAITSACEVPAGHTLIICPYKPVAQAQRRAFENLAEHLPRLRTAFIPYDGDLDAHRRAQARNRRIVLTNPDTLHREILPNHSLWADFFSRLRYVVLEELHCYSGLFGSNAANLFRRLWRVCKHYDARPQLIATSSTLANPAELAELATGTKVHVLDADTAPRGPRTYLLWSPAAEPPSMTAGRLVARLVANDAGTIAFSRSRVSCELIARYARQLLGEETGGLSTSVVAYRGGYPVEERRRIEGALHDGTIRAVSSTNALELGLDAHGLDAVIVCGWPGSRASFFQQAARAGRSGRPSLVILVALADPVNRFLMRHPEHIFQRPPEPAVIERANPHVLAGHLRCAARELPLRDDEARSFGDHAPEVLRMLEERKKLRHADGCWFHVASESPARELPLRGYFDRDVLIQDMESGRVIAEVDWLGAHSLVHPGAIYLHGERAYLVEQFDREACRAHVREVRVGHYTNPLGRTFVDSVDHCLRQKSLPGGLVFFGEVTAGAVTEGFEERRCGDNALIRTQGIALPPVRYETMALWLCLSNVREAEFAALGSAPDFYGLGNAVRIVLPLFMTCDVLDLRPWCGRTNFPWPALYLYERYPRGLGFSEKVLDQVEQVLGAAEQNVSDCACGDGCTQCVGDPVRPYILNNPELEADLIPSRREVLLLLRGLLSDEPLEGIVASVFGAEDAARMLKGRRELLGHMRESATGEPARMLPSDEPLDVAPKSETTLPLQLKRGVRRRLEKVRTAELQKEQAPVQETKIPEPECGHALSAADPEMRHLHRVAARLEEQKKRARQPHRKEVPRAPERSHSHSDPATIASEAVRRVKKRRRRSD